MDDIDRRILHELQHDARATITDLAERVRISVSSCHRHLRELEQSGVIESYRAHVDPAAVGLTFQALVFVTMREGGRATIDEFETQVAHIPSVLEAQRLFGDPDYLLRIVARDLDDFRRIYDDELTPLPAVQRLTSTLIMKTIVVDRELPV